MGKRVGCFPFCIKLPEICRVRLGKPILPVKIVKRPANTMANGPVESCLVGLLAGPVVVLSHQTGVVLARYNPGQDVYSSGKPAIYSRLAR